MKKTLLMTAAAMLATVLARADALEDLSPAPRLIVRGTNALNEVTASGTNGWYRLTIRRGRPAFSASDSDGTRSARATFRQLQHLSGRAPLPDVTVIDWPATAVRGLSVDSRVPFGGVRSMRLVLAESARKKVNTVVWRVGPGTNSVFDACSDSDYRDLAYFAFRVGVDLVPSIDPETPALRGREAEFLSAAAALVPSNGLRRVDLGASPSPVWRKALAANGKALLADIQDRRIESAPVPENDSQFEIPTSLARRLWQGDGE